MARSRIIPDEPDSSGQDVSPPTVTPARTSKQALSFVVITNPRQAKDKKNKRAVRSHVMFDYNASKKQESRKPASDVVAPADSSKQRTGGSSSESEGPNDGSRSASGSARSDESLGQFSTLEDVEQSLVSGRRTHVKATGSPDEPRPQDPSRYYRALLLRSKDRGTKARSQEVLVRDDDTVERLWKAGFAAQYSIRSLGDADAFLVLPQFRNPMIYMAELKTWCTRRFGTDAMAVHWVPMLAQDRLTYLAALCVGASDMDVGHGLHGDSATTVAIKTEVIEMVNEQLGKPEKQCTDDTIMAILLLLYGEIASGDEWVWRVHESGITNIVLHRGGLQTLGIHGDLAVVVFSIVVMTNIILESQPHDIYKQYVPIKLGSKSSQKTIPESPTFCPRNEFFTIARSRYCSERLYDLLSDMRDLTNQVVDQDSASSSPYRNSDGSETDSSVPEHFQFAQELLAKVRSIPPFNPAQDAPSYAAWTFEACRIAALIYTTAVVSRVPFSDAAMLVDLYDNDDGLPLDGALPNCLHKLRDAVANSNISESWADLIGVLFWVALLGGAAARRLYTSDGWTENDTWTRKYLNSTALRVSVLICFEHGQATMSMLRRLSEFQRRLKPSTSHNTLRLELTP